jgi:hypothetical protein
MATLLPPPKRQKVYNGIPEPEKVTVEQSPNVVVQFVSEDDGSALAPAVSLPANVSREDLQSLVNRLTSKVRAANLHPRPLTHPTSRPRPPKADEPVPFQFHVALPADAVTKDSSRIVISKSIEADVLSHSSHAFSPEDILVVYCSPQSVFRVRPATRCSSSLSGRVMRFVFFLMHEHAVTPHHQVIHRRYSARLSPRRGTSLPRAREMPMHACGICLRKRLRTRSPGTKIGSCVSSGRLLNENWRRGDTTAM